MKRFVAITLVLCIITMMTTVSVFADITSGLKIWLPMDMDTSSDNTLYEPASGTVNVKLNNNPLAYDNGVIGGALYFDGVSTNVTLPHIVKKDFTISFWLKTDTAGATGTQWYQCSGLVDGEVGGIKNDFGISLNGKNIIFGIGNPDTCITGSIDVTDNTWHNIVCTRDTSTGSIKIYVDGKLDKNGTAPNKGEISDTHQLEIGGVQGGPSYKGSIDEVRIYDKVLAESDINELFSKNNQIPPEVEDDVNPYYRTSAFKMGSDKVLIMGDVFTMTQGGKGAQTITKNGTTYVLAKYLAQTTGKYVNWNEKTQSATITAKGRSVTMENGSNKMTLQDGSVVEARGALEITDNTLVWIPLEDVAVKLGMTILVEGDYIIVSPKAITDDMKDRAIQELNK